MYAIGWIDLGAKGLSPKDFDLWLYDVATKHQKRLTSDGERRSEVFPRFVSRTQVAFLATGSGENNSVIGLLSLDTGGVCQVFSWPNWMGAFDWSPDGRRIAFVALDPQSGRTGAYVYSVADRKWRLIRRLEGGGRGGSQVDAISVSWSLDGESLLVNDTQPTDGSPTLFVLRPDGKDLVPPRLGTHAIWDPRGGAVLFTTFLPERQGDESWYSVAVPSGSLRRLAILPGSLRPSDSPDRRAIAVDDAAPRPRVYVFDLATGSGGAVGQGVAPIWLDSSTLLATEAKPCSGSACDAAPWEGQGSTIEISLSPTGSVHGLPLSTFDADVLYE